MPSCFSRNLVIVAVAGLTLVAAISCAPEYRPPWLGGTLGLTTTAAGNVFTGNPAGKAFSEQLLSGRTFIDGRAVVTTTHRVEDMTRKPVLIDFNSDGRVDPVIAYEEDPYKRGVIQILLSQGDPGAVKPLSLTLDGGDNPWAELLDVAVGDIDGDGRLDIVAATRDGVVYLHHPSAPYQTTDLRQWGAASGDLELIAGTTSQLTNDELTGLIAQAFGPTVDVNNYVVTVQQGYTHVEIADINKDGWNDIVASRRIGISMQPKPGLQLDALQTTTGTLQVLLNPGAATTGAGWQGISVGQHERHHSLDRNDARGLQIYDLDGDGWLDIVSAASWDNDVQVAWFRNPGASGPVDASNPWTQYRIGSLRGAFSIALGDFTGRGHVDVVATGPAPSQIPQGYGQSQMMLFVQPDSGPMRPYDWDSFPIVTFKTYNPVDVIAVDLDNDGVPELVVGGTNGAIRYFTRPADPTTEWPGQIVLDADPPGEIGLLGFGDLDGDGDVDLIATVDTKSQNSDIDDRLIWIRNDLVP